MSFILDALRKSDTQRQEQTAPGLATTQQRGHKKTRNIWIPLLVGVLALNALVMGWVLLSDPGTDESSPSAVARTPDADPTLPSLRTEALPARPAPVPPPHAAGVRGTVATPDAGAAISPLVATPPTPAPEPVMNVSATGESSTLPSFQQLLVSGILSMPALHLDIHVYASDSRQRFVFINMRKYRENERLSDGPVVETITRTGVILAHQGNRFTLERD